MPFPPSRAMLDRPKQTIHAAELIHGNAASIAGACMDAAAGEVVVAVVDHRDMVFAGTWTIPKEQIQARVPQLDDGGWSLLFSPRTGRDVVEERALQMARLAFRRWEVMQRWISRHAEDMI